MPSLILSTLLVGSSNKITGLSFKKARAMGVPIRDYKKIQIILMGTPASAS